MILKIPGFYYTRSSCVPHESHRGGVGALVKSVLWPFVMELDLRKDQVWFKLEFTPGLIFGGIYIPPSDSPYFSNQSFADIQEKCYEGNDILLLGDLNARLGNLSGFEDTRGGLSYTNNVDRTTNQNGQKLVQLCTDLNLTPVNHASLMGIDFNGKLTYKKGNDWISQIDWCFVSKNIIKNICNFQILENIPAHSDHAAIVVDIFTSGTSLNQILECASFLGRYAVNAAPRKTIKYEDINCESFQLNLTSPDSVWQSTDVISEATNILYDTCKMSTNKDSHTVIQHQALGRWKSILQTNNPKLLWDAIGWKGTFDVPNKSSSPSDAVFSEHFSKLLNSSEQCMSDIDIPQTNVYIPILDDHIMPDEVVHQINRMKSRKSPGTDGIPPGILKCLSDAWILLLTFIMNIVFYGSYPAQWTIARIFVIFKKGLMSDPNNYRGISVMNMLPKLYDGILNCRLNKWYKPCVEQAGSQSSRSCEEQILTLRLYIDIARKKKYVLYILFVDYTKAYDKVNRSKLLHMLADHGCGNTFLNAIGSSIKNTYNIIGSEKFRSTCGVKQGSATSCSLFTFYLDQTVRELRTFGEDGFIGNNHILLLMDDTILLATSREAMERKVALLYNSAKSIDMLMHPDKSQYMAVNSDDVEPFYIENVKISRTNKYTYLGSIITVDSTAKQVEANVKNKLRHSWKFQSFVHKNIHAPYRVKETALRGAVNSSILYGCESWLTNDLKCADRVVLSCLKTLLGVRNQTSSDLVYIETNSAPISAVIKTRQRNFLTKIMNRPNFEEYPVGRALVLAQREKSPMATYINKLLDRTATADFVSASKLDIMNRVKQSDKSRMIIYRSINSDLSQHDIYTCLDSHERERISFSRLRLSSHRLKVETGRWSRIPQDQRLCVCGHIQTEEHVLTKCPETEVFRNNHSTLDYTNINNLMRSQEYISLVSYCNKVLRKMES